MKNATSISEGCAGSGCEPIGKTDSGSAIPTKTLLLTELLKKPEVYDQLDSAWRLVMWLMMVEHGVVICGYDEIAERLGGSKHTVKKWAEVLEGKGLLEKKPNGKVVELRLTGDFMKIALAPDAVIAENPVPRQESPVMNALAKIIEGTEELGGQITMTLSGCNLGK
jgi:hypothetical protein